MPDVVVHAVVRLPNIGGNPKNDVINTFTFRSGTDGEVAMGVNAVGAIEDFYNGGGDIGVSGFFSSMILRSADVPATITLTNITGNLDGTGPMPAPYDVSNFELNAVSPGNIDIPNEVACVLSMRAISNTGRKVRGRVFLGPFHTEGLGDNGGIVRFNGYLIGTIATAAGRLRDYDADLDWVVWSRKDAAVFQVESAYVNNEIDLLNSRGAPENTRSLV